MSSLTTRCGLASGVLFFLNALIPGSQSWPFIWPLLGGVVVIVLMWRRGERFSIVHALAAGARVGVIAGLISLVLVLPTIGFFATQAAVPVLRALGGPVAAITLSASVVISLVIVSLLEIPVSIIGAVVTRPFLRPRHA